MQVSGPALLLDPHHIPFPKFFCFHQPTGISHFPPLCILTLLRHNQIGFPILDGRGGESGFIVPDRDEFFSGNRTCRDL